MMKQEKKELSKKVLASIRYAISNGIFLESYELKSYANTLSLELGHSIIYDDEGLANNLCHFPFARCLHE